MPSKHSAAKTAPPTTSAQCTRDFAAVAGLWLALVVVLFCLGRENVTLPGLYYDEAVFGGFAKDFVFGPAHGQHLHGAETVQLFGHPFPVFIQSYLGAVKSWLLIPTIKMFGATVPVLRLTNLALSLAALLLFMLWVWRIAGVQTALIAGPLLAFDPSFFFLSYLDWGAAVVSFLCRLAGFFLAVMAWQKRRAGFAFLAGLSLGLGLFNKVDFAILLLGVALALAISFAAPLAAAFKGRRNLFGLAGIGFLICAAPILSRAFRVFGDRLPNQPGEWNEKLHATLSMYDGSYFYRLMDAGGVFTKMYDSPSAAWTPMLIAVLATGAILAMLALRRGNEQPERRLWIFILLALIFTSIGALLLPGANRIHHTTLVYPFPQLVVASALIAGWTQAGRWPKAAWLARVLVAGSFVTLLAWQIVAITRTQQLIRDTRGQGWWSDAMAKFCDQVKDRKDLVIVSLDWGFNEQLLFLTDGPALKEPFPNWNGVPPETVLPKLPLNGNFIYLLHPDQYSLFAYGPAFARMAAPPGKREVVQNWRDGRGNTVFYAVQFVDNVKPQ